MGVQIKDIKTMPIGERISGIFAINSIYRDTASNDSHYLRIGLSDNSGKIDLMVWGTKLQTSISGYVSLVQNDVIEIENVEIDAYKGKTQLKVNSTPRGFKKLAEDEYDLADLVLDTKRPKAEMFEYITQKMDEIDDTNLKSLLTKFVSDTEIINKFKTAPAAMIIHHAHTSGLLEHTWEVLNYCEKLVEVHPTLDKDLVYVGAIFHDIGKIHAYVATITIDTSREGMLLDHTYLGCEIVSKYISEIPGFPDDLHNKLRHIILSHHGEKNMGAVLKPVIPEAAAVHSADMMGSLVVQYINAVNNYEGSDFKTAKRDWFLKTKIYVE